MSKIYRIIIKKKYINKKMRFDFKISMVEPVYISLIQIILIKC